MSYGIDVNAADDVPVELLEEFNIPTEPIIYCGSEKKPEVAKHFVDTIVDIGKRVEELLKTNGPIIMLNEE